MLPDKLCKTCPASFLLHPSCLNTIFHDIIAYLLTEVPNFTHRNKILHHTPGF